MVHRNFSFSFRAPIARLLSSKQYAKAGMLGTTDKMAYPFSLPTDRKGRIVETLSAFEWKNLKRCMKNDRNNGWPWVYRLKKLLVWEFSLCFLNTIKQECPNECLIVVYQ